MMKQLTVGELCSRAILSVSPETPVSHALQLMVRQQKSCLLVKLHEEIIGIVTERDVVRFFAKIAAFQDLAVRDIMSSPLLTIEASRNAYVAFEQMQLNHIRHFAVLDTDYTPLGLLSLTDLIHKFAPSCIPPDTPVANLMARQVASADADKPIRQVLGEMTRRSISCMLICDNQQPVGMFSERDVPHLFLTGDSELDRPVRMVMTPLHPTIAPQTSALEAIATMQARGIRRLVVAAENGNVVGLITQTLLGRAVAI
jgi:CBS domain-containing protein